MPQETQIPFSGLSLQAGAAQTEKGACRTLSGVARPPGRQGWVPAATAEDAGVGSLNDLSRQALGDGARLLALRGGGELVAIDPATYSVTSLASLPGTDSTRRLKSATVSRDTAVAITSGAGVGDPEVFKIVREDTVTDLPWPSPPTYSVTWSKRSEGDGAPAGTYVVRVAWRMEDGTIGPASGPLLTTTPETDTDATYEATISVDGYPGGKPGGGWPDRIEGLAIIVHPEAASSSATDVSAPDVPGYRVSSFDGLPDAGTTTKWKDTLESIIAAQPHNTRTLVHHRISAGALYSFNGRLILGDVAYDYERPQLGHMVGGADGGTDYHLTMRVDVETSQGTITRYAEPIGFSSGAADAVQVRQGTIYYRDRRARSWAWLVSEDYTGSIDDATWKIVDVQGTESELKEAGNANFSYVEPARSALSIKALKSISKDITGNSGWSGKFRSFAYDVEREEDRESPEDEDAPNTASLAVSNALTNDEQLEAVRVDTTLGATVSGRGGGYGTASATLTIKVKDGTGSDATVIGSLTIEVDEDDQGGNDVYVLTDFPSPDAKKIELTTDASASATRNGGEADANANADVEGVEIDVVTAKGGTTEKTTRSQAKEERDRDRTRIVWSEPNRPLDLPIENIVRVGEDADDPVLAITSNAAPISEGQYGDYPLIVLGRRSIWSLQVGGEVFVQGASPIAPDMGVVGREAFINANGPVVAATDQGLVELTPSVGEVLSTPLHDGSFLPALGPETSVSYYTSDDGRREVWVAVGSELLAYSLGAGAWSTLPATRGPLTRLQSATFGLEGGALKKEGAGAGTYSVTIETAPAFLGSPSSTKRLRDVWLVQGTPPPQDNMQLLHVRSIGEEAVGLDYTTDVTVPMRLSRGLVRAMSVWLKADASESATFTGVGVRYELRDRSTPRGTIDDEGKLLGPGATQSELDADLSW